MSTGADGVIGSLRQAILDVDAAGGKPTISFTLASPYVITPTSALPPITQAAVVDGTSLSGYAFGTTMVELDGGSSGGGDGLILGAGSGGSTIEGLDIVGFQGGCGHPRGVGQGSRSARTMLGLTTAGANGANQVGVLVDHAAGATIGGTSGGRPPM